MTDDRIVFWRNNEQASALFYDLIDRTERSAYDDDFLAQLASYREVSPNTENADLFAACYLLHHGDTAAALICAERAYRRRPVRYAIWTLLAEIYTRLGRTIEALTMYGYAYGLHLAPDIPIELAVRGGTEGLNRGSERVRR